MAKKCGNCRFWARDLADTYNPEEPDDYFSDCRRFPPPSGRTIDVDENFTGRFPVTLAGEWCGEWQPQKTLDIKRWNALLSLALDRPLTPNEVAEIKAFEQADRDQQPEEEQY